MATHNLYPEKETAFFVTFKCYKWLSLIQESNAYDSFYKWFGYVKQQNCHILGYVIMPNHFHGLIYVSDQSNSAINQLLANGKRFIAYDIVKGLSALNRKRLIELNQLLTPAQIKSGKKHRVFSTSSDIKPIYDRKSFEGTLDYVHTNPCQSHWDLVEDPVQYLHSSAGYYTGNTENQHITDYTAFY